MHWSNDINTTLEAAPLEARQAIPSSAPGGGETGMPCKPAPMAGSSEPGYAPQQWWWSIFGHGAARKRRSQSFEFAFSPISVPLLDELRKGECGDENEVVDRYVRLEYQILP